MKKTTAKIFTKTIVYGALSVIGILAISMCVFLGGIMLVWTLTDKLVRRLERNTEK